MKKGSMEEANFSPVKAAFKREESQHYKFRGGHPAGPALLSGPCAFFRGILPAKVWKLLSEIHMVNRFRDSFHWKTFFLPDSLQCCLERQWLSHQQDWACFQHAVPHTRAPAFILSALPSPPLTLCFPLSGLALHKCLGREVRKCRQKKKKEKKEHWLSEGLTSVCLALTCVPGSPSFCLALCSSQWDVLTLVKRCACSIS